MNTPKSYEYVYSGTLDIDSPTYTIRKADTELYEGLKAGKLCYVFNSRKTGKSSLRVQTMRRLQNDGIACAAIDLSMGGTNYATPDQWYADIIDTLVERFDLDFDLDSWWSEQELLSPVKRFSKFIETVLLVQIPPKKSNNKIKNNSFTQKVVIFIDEIDSVLSLKFSSDDFFALIRACYNQRADNPIYNHLTFCLLGVATPSDLIADKQRTPFNIGQAIELTGFTLEEAKPSLAPGLAHKVSHPEAVLQEVLYWTGGQPFLTQKVCNLLVKSPTHPPANGEAIWVEQLVRSLIISNWESQDEPEHLRTIRDRILHSKQRTGRLLGIYQQILLSAQLTSNNRETGGVTVDDSPEQVELRLSGLVVKENATLKVYNKIYKSVFDLNWVDKELAKLRPYSQALTAWFDSSCQDESRLLRGQALRDAQKWAAEKSLSDRDYKFLAESEALDKRQITIALDAERQATQILEEAQQKAELALEEERKANQRLAEAQRKTRQQIRIGAAVLVLSILGVITAVVVAGKASSDAAKANEQRLKAENQRLDAEKKEQIIRKDLNTTSRDLQNEKKRLDQKTKKLEQITQQFQAAEKKVELAQKAMDNATAEQKRAQQQEKNAQGDLKRTESARNIALKEKQQAQQNLQKAKDDLDQTQSARKIALEDLEVAKINEAGLNALQIFKSSGEIEALLLAMQSGQKLKALLQDGLLLEKYSTANLLLALQTILDNIQQRNYFKSHQTDILDVSFSPDGRYFVTTGEDGTVRIWNLKGEQKILTGNKDNVDSVSFSPDGQLFATTGGDARVRLWDIKGNLVKDWMAEDASHKVIFTPDGQRLLTAGANDGIVRIWNLKGQQLEQLNSRSPQRGIMSMSFSPDGQYLVTAGFDEQVILRNLKSRKIEFKEKHEGGWIQSTDFSPDGRQFAIAGEDDTVRLWDLHGKELATFKANHSSNHSSVKFSPDGHRLVTAGEDGTVKFWNLQGKQLAQSNAKKSSIASFSLTKDGKRLVSVGQSGMISLWNLLGQPVTQMNVYDNRAIVNVSFSQNRELFATAGRDSYVQLWNVQGQKLAKWVAHEWWYINSVSLSPDGRRMATAGDRLGTVRLWDVEQLKTSQKPEPLIEWGSEQRDYIDEMSFSTDGYLATAGKDGTVKIWDTKKIVTQSNGRRSPVLLAQLNGHQGQVLSVHFSTDGQLLASSGEDGTARIWNLQGKELAKLNSDNGRVLSVRFSTDGQLLATSGEDGTARIWNFKTQQVHELKGYSGLVSSLSFSPDGKLLATGGQDSTVRLWNLKGQQLTQLFTYQGWIRSVNFSKDGRQIITAGQDGTVQVRHLSEIKDLDGLLKQGCEWLKDYLATHPNAPQVCSDIK